MRRRLTALALAALLVASSVASLGAAMALSSDAGPQTLESVDDSPTRAVDGPARAVEEAARSSDDGETGSESTVESASRPPVLSTSEDLTFDAAKNQVLRGESTLPTGTELMVVVANRDPDFVAIHTTRVQVDGTFREELDLSGLPAGTEVTVRVYHGDDPVVNQSATVTEPNEGTSLDTRWNRIYLSPGAETVTGTTNRSPGTRLTVRVDSMGDTELEQNRTVVVGEDGSFQATFDLSDVPHATHLRISVVDEGERIDYAHGLVFR